MAPRLFTEADFADSAPAQSSSLRTFTSDDFLPEVQPVPSFHDAVEAESPWYGNVASGTLSGIAGLGDLLQSGAEVFIPNPANEIQNAKREMLIAEALRQGISQSDLDSPEGQAIIGNFAGDAPQSKGLGDFMRQAFDTATGVEGSTQINPGSYWHKFGSYLPGSLMGPGDFVNGIRGTITNAAKTLGVNTALSGGGYVGQHTGERVGEALGGEQGRATGGILGELFGTGAVASLPYLAKKAYQAFVDVPTEEQALIKAFQVPKSKVNEIAPKLERLKSTGIINPLETEAPFQAIAGNLDDAIRDSQSNISSALEGKSTTIGEIWPESDLFGRKLKSGADSKAALSALRAEQDNLTKIALLKLKPAPEGVDALEHGDELLRKYKALEKAALKSDKAAEKLLAIDKAIDATEVTGQELWELRQGYDGGASWNKIDPKGKSVAYRAMRDAAQEKLLELGGDSAPGLFQDFDAQLKGRKYVEGMAGLEKKGMTQGPGIVQTTIDNLVRRPFGKVLSGITPSTKPEVSLRQAFGPVGVGSAIEKSQIPLVAPRALLGAQDSLRSESRESPQVTSQSSGAAKPVSGNQSLLSIPSLDPNTPIIDRAMAKAELKLSEPLEVIGAKRISQGENGKVEPFIEKAEGGQRLKAYALDSKGSGVTVATGVDLGKRTEFELKHLGLSEDLITKLKPYLGKTDEMAKKVLERKPLRLTQTEADQLDKAVKTDIENQLTTKLDRAGVELTSLPAEAQTVVRSLAYNFGPGLNTKVPSLWSAIVSQDWPKLRQLLLTTKWKQPELRKRRAQEAALLKQIIET